MTPGAAPEASLAGMARRLGLGALELESLVHGALRLPALAPGLLAELQALARDDPGQEAAALHTWLEEQLQRPELRPLIATASPQLLQYWEGGGKDDAARGALLRYLLRAASRCTPVGLLAWAAAARFDAPEGCWPDLRALPIRVAGLQANTGHRRVLASERVLARRGNRIVAAEAHSQEEALLDFREELWRELRGIHPDRGRSPVQEQLVRVRLLDTVAQPELTERFLKPGEVDSFQGVTAAVVAETVPLPASVRRAIAHRALALLSCQSLPDSARRLRTYHRLFRDRFTDEWVCAAELADPLISGLPAPWEADLEPPSPADEARARWLATVYHRGMAAGGRAVLEDDELSRFAAPAAREVPVADGFEAGCLLVASSQADLERGAFTLVPGSLHGSGAPHRSLGRFLGCLPQTFRDEVLGHQRTWEGERGALHAEVVWTRADSPPSLRWAAHAWSSEVICNGAPRMASRRRVRPEDVMVRAASEGFVFALRDGTPLVLHQGHMLAPRASPRVARLLLELAMEGARHPGGFDWRELGNLPRLPRLTWRGQILCLARWRPGGPYSRERAGALRDWREANGVPRVVCLVENERRLPIDLESHWGRTELLRASRSAAASCYLEEAPWLEEATARTVVCEVVPSFRRRLPAPAPRQQRPPADGTRIHRQWRSFTLFADEAAQRRLLVALRPMLPASPGDWHYVRFQEGPRRLVRLRWRGESPLDRFESLLDLALEHGATDVRQETFRPETFRYGGADALDAALRVFTWDSDSALGSWGAGREPERLLIETGAVMAAYLELLLGRAAGAAACRERSRRTEVAPLIRRLRARQDLLERLGRDAPPRALVELLRAWRDATPNAGPREALSFTHMAANRRLGSRRGQESVAQALAETLLQARMRAEPQSSR